MAADFIFRIDSVQLTEAQQAKVASAIQGAVLTELAKLDLHGDPTKRAAAPALGGSAVSGFLYIPIHWYGGRMIGTDGVASAVDNVLTVAERSADQARAAQQR